jgi:hypothetical protein
LHFSEISAIRPYLRAMQTPADLAFHERLARDLLERKGSAVSWRLHLDAIEAERDGHPGARNC